MTMPQRYPNITRNEYLFAVQALLQNWLDAKLISKNEYQVGVKLATDRFDIEGWHGNLPYVQDYLFKPQFQEFWEKEAAKQGLDEQELELAQAKFEESKRQWESEQALAREKTRQAQSQFEAEQAFSQQQSLWDRAEQEKILALKARAVAAQTEAQRLASMWQASERDIRESEQRKMAGTFEEWRNRLLGELETQPRNWVTDWQLRNKPNPYTVEPRTPEEEAQKWEEDYKKASTEEKNAAASFNDMAKRVTDNATLVNTAELEAAKQRYENAVNIRQGIEQAKTERGLYTIGTSEYAESQPRVDAFGNATVGTWEPPQPAKPTKPPIPTEVAPFLGKSEFGAPVVTPSGQQWMGTPWSAQEKVLGYAESIGQRPEDIASQMEMMRPYNPNIAYRWSPSRQR